MNTLSLDGLQVSRQTPPCPAQSIARQRAESKLNALKSQPANQFLNTSVYRDCTSQGLAGPGLLIRLLPGRNPNHHRQVLEAMGKKVLEHRAA